MNYIEGLVIIVGMIVGTFCIKELVKTIFVELGLYRKKLNQPYEKVINSFFEGMNLLTEKMGKVLDRELNKDSETKVEINWDESLKK